MKGFCLLHTRHVIFCDGRHDTHEYKNYYEYEYLVYKKRCITFDASVEVDVRESIENSSPSAFSESRGDTICKAKTRGFKVSTTLPVDLGNILNIFGVAQAPQQ